MLVANHGAPIARILQKDRNKTDGGGRKEVVSSSEVAHKPTNRRALFLNSTARHSMSYEYELLFYNTVHYDTSLTE